MSVPVRYMSVLMKVVSGRRPPGAFLTLAALLTDLYLSSDL